MCTLGFQRSLRLERMGRAPYAPMLALQKSRHADVFAGDVDDTLFLLEHEPVITLGKNGGAEHLLADAGTLAERDVQVVESGRGGDVTFHGPGQIVGYAILRLDEEERDVRQFVAGLEEVMIRAAWDFGVAATRVDGLRGIWVGNDKLGAIGVRLSRWTTMHGFALNVSTDLEQFAMIVPCGLEGRGVTSLRAQLGEQTPSQSQVEDRIALHFGDVFNRRMYDKDPTPLPAPTEMATAAAANEVHP